MTLPYPILPLEKEKWKGHPLPIGYTTNTYYDVTVDRTDSGFSVNMVLTDCSDHPITHTPEEYDFPDKLYEDYRPDSRAYGMVDNDGNLIAAIEIEPEGWSNRLRVHELWIDDRYHKRGIGRALMNLAKDEARKNGHRMVMLETQSCNTNAIGFYLHEGFTLIGFDACCYANNDLERKEVRIELGWDPMSSEKED